MNYFTPKELECPCPRCKGKNTHEKFDKRTLRWLNYYRKKLNFPLSVTSGYRCKAYQKELYEANLRKPVHLRKTVAKETSHSNGTEVDISKRKMTAQQKKKFIDVVAKSTVFHRYGFTYKNHYHIGTGKPKEVAW